MNTNKLRYYFISILLGMSIFAPLSHAAGGSQGYQQYLEDLEKISKETADKVKAAANSASTLAEEARDIVRYDLTGFLDSIQKTEKFGADKVRKLTAITPNNTGLTWDKSKERVLMVSWMPKWAADAFYRPKLNKELTVSRDMWVTVSPEVRNFIKNYKGSVPLHYRLQQLLGLPIKKSDNYFVESWVRPADIVRPCVNPEITNTQCEPESAVKNPSNAEHMKWYQAEKKDKYTGKYVFPWTRLGWTCDWAKPGCDFGFTEFVIKPGAKIIVKDIIPTDQYK